MSENQTVSPFNKPENWVRWVFTAGLLCLAGYFAYKVLPYVDQIIDMGWYAIAAGVPLAAVIFIGVNKGVHSLIWNAWTIALTWATGRVFELDPIAIMQRYANHYADMIVSIKEALGGFRGQIKNLLQQISENNVQIQQSLNMASQARDELKNDPSMSKTMELEAFKAGQYEESNKNFQSMVDFLNAHLERCSSMLSVFSENKMKLDTTIKIKSSERKAMLDLRKTISVFERLTNGDEELQNFNKAIEIENQFVAQTLGKAEQFTDDSQSILQQSKLNRLANKSDAIARIDAWNKQKIDALKLPAPGMRVDSNITPTPAQQNSSGSFDDLFDSPDEIPTAKVSRVKN